MKATLILAALIPMAVWMGCKDNAIDPFSESQIWTDGQSGNTIAPQYQLVWELDELSITSHGVDGETLENTAIYSNLPPNPPIASYVVSFDASTNADRWTNGYAPLAQISMDEENVFEESDFATMSDPVYHKEIRLDNVRFYDLIFRVALFQVDGANRPIQPMTLPVVNPDGTTLTLSNIKIFKSN